MTPVAAPALHPAVVARHGLRPLAALAGLLLAACVWLPALAEAQPVGSAPAPSYRVHEGYVSHNDPAGERYYYFRYLQDSLLVLGEGFEGDPRVTLPHGAFVGVLRALHRTGALRDTVALRYALDAQFAAPDPGAMAVSMQAPVPLVVAVFGFALAALLGVVLHVRVRREAVERSRERALRIRLAEAREAERTHFARELHDGPIQDLCAVQFALAALAPRGEGAEPARQGVDVTRSAVNAVVSELRGLCDRLRPPSLEAFGLPTALEALAQRVSEQHPDLHVGLHVEADPAASALASDLQLALFRIAQEALTNAARHARASRAEIALALSPSSFRLSVDDDGTGPPAGDPLDYARQGHYGLLGMRERADLLGATLRVDRSPLGGTRIAVARSGRGTPAAHAAS